MAENTEEGIKAEQFSNVQFLSPDEVRNIGKPEPTNEPVTTPSETATDDTGTPPIDVPANSAATGQSSLNLLTPEDIAAAEEAKRAGTLDTGDKTKKTTSSINSDVYAALASQLVKDGIISATDEFDPTSVEGSAQILELVSKTIETNSRGIHESWKSSLPNEQKEYLGLTDAGISHDQAKPLANMIARYDAMDEASLSDTDLEDAYRDYLSLKGLDKTEIDRTVGDALSLDKLSERGKEAVPKIKQALTDQKNALKQAADEQDRLAAENRKKSMDKLISSIESQESIIKDVPLSKMDKDALKKSLTEAVGYDNNGRALNAVMANQMKNPAEFNKLLHLYNHYGLFNIADDGTPQPNLDRLKALIKTEATNDLDTALQQQRVVGGGTHKLPAGTSSFLEKLEKGKG